MSENINFIPANELPELEAETVDVLAVDPETGEMGKKSGASLGGGKWDGVVTHNNIPCYFQDNYIELTAFDFTAIKEKIQSGKDVIIMLHCVYDYGDSYEIWAKSSAVMYNSSSDTIAICWPTPYSTANTTVCAVNATAIIGADGSVVAASWGTA